MKKDFKDFLMMMRDFVLDPLHSNKGKEQAYETICTYDSIDELRTFLDGLSGKEQQRFNQYAHQGLWKLTYKHDIDSIRLVLDTPFLNPQPSKKLDIFLHNFFHTCCIGGDLLNVRYLLERCKFKEHIIKPNDYQYFDYALSHANGKKELLDYLLDRQDIPQAHIHSSFVAYCKNKDTFVRDYFIRDRSLEFNPSLIQALQGENLQDVISLVKIHKLAFASGEEKKSMRKGPKI